MSFPSRPSSGTRSYSDRSKEYKPPQARSTNPSITRTSSKSSSQSQQTSKSSFLAAVDDLYRLECDTWAFEVLSITVSLAALGTVLIALYHYDGKPAPEWPYSLTLNAFISVCMMIMGAALTVPVSNGLGQLKWLLARQGDISVIDLDTLDRASRGMWGSLCVIFGLTGGMLASLGSVITILVFAIAPFAQQAIFSSVGGIESLQNPATFVSACGPSSAIREICADTSISGATKKGQSVVPTFLRGGYYSAVYGSFNRSVAPINFASCPTGNCTWAPFTTLSVCSQCKNVTEFLEHEKTNSFPPQGELTTLPGGPSMDSGFDTFQLAETNASTRIRTDNATSYTFAALEGSSTTSTSALECSLSFCVQLIKAKFSDGVFHEEIVEEFKNSHLQLGFQVPDSNISSFDQLLVFEPLETVNGTLYPPISVQYAQPACLAQVFRFDRREELALTEMGLENITSMVDNLAVSVGRGIRTICNNNTRILGSSWDNVTLVRINWPWLILPLAVELLGLSFFLWVSISNKLSNTKLWKSSLVAALYHGPELPVCAIGDRGEEHMDVEGLFDMESVAGKMKVVLSDGGVDERGGEGAVMRSRLLVKGESQGGGEGWL